MSLIFNSLLEQLLKVEWGGLAGGDDTPFAPTVRNLLPKMENV
jgi:hypothetical protein